MLERKLIRFIGKYNIEIGNWDESNLIELFFYNVLIFIVVLYMIFFIIEKWIYTLC